MYLIDAHGLAAVPLNFLLQDPVEPRPRTHQFRHVFSLKAHCSGVWSHSPGSRDE